MFNKIVYAVCITITLAIGMVVINSYQKVTAIKVKDINTQVLKVTNGSSEIVKGRVVLQPTFNPQQQ